MWGSPFFTMLAVRFVSVVFVVVVVVVGLKTEMLSNTAHNITPHDTELPLKSDVTKTNH